MRYLSRAEVARYIGLKNAHSLSNNRALPEPDVMVGNRRGWSHETIDSWNAARPGSGRWGSRE
jgi:predicted DNA-binding transcriptional regulator AlpA